MNEKVMLDLSLEVFTDIEKLFKQEFGEEYITKIQLIEDMVALSTVDFIMTFKPKFAKFGLTFAVGNTGRNVASCMLIITSVIEPHEIEILPDFYYNNKTQELSYGDEALESQYLAVIDKKGKAKCHICEIVYAKEDVENGICKYCKIDSSSIVWH